MLFYLLFMITVPLTQGVHILLTNQEGWIEKNARTFFEVLSGAGHSVLLVAPRFGPGDPPVNMLRQDELTDCDVLPCPTHPLGFNLTDQRLAYYDHPQPEPVMFGIRAIGPMFWRNPENERPRPQLAELALAGPGVGNILGTDHIQAPSIVAIKHAARWTPAISFAGATGPRTRWNADLPRHSKVYAQLAFIITTTLIESGKPYLPKFVYLNVNFAGVTPERCRSVNDFKFIRTRGDRTKSVELLIRHCHRLGFPYDADIMNRRNNECLVTISVGYAYGVSGPDVSHDREITRKLEPILSCP